jgi:anti-sigma-K factor RskA
MNDHELIEELTSARALGALEPEDAATLEAKMASHGPDCPECRRLAAQSEEVAGRLAFALGPVSLPEGFEERVVALATAEPTVLGGAPSELERQAVRRRGRRFRPLVAAAAALLLFAGGWVASDLLEADTGRIPAGARVVALQGETAGSLTVAYEPGERGVYLLGSDLERLAADRVYELWMIRDGTPVSGACFRPAADGSVFRFVDADVGATDVMAVTVEPSACSKQPTTEPILVAEIASA